MKTSRHALFAITVFILALSVRLIYLYQIKHTPLFGLFAVDSQYYNRFALEILRGDFFFKQSVYFHPLYPFFVAFIYKISGYSFLAIGIFQALLDSLTCILIYIITIKIFDKKSVGLIAAFIYAFYGTAIFYTAFILDTTLSIFIAASMIALLLCAAEEKRKKIAPFLWFVSGVVIALSMLLKAFTLFFIPFLMLWLFFFNGKKLILSKKLFNLGLVIVGIFIILLPFSIRNYVLQKSFSPFPAHGGINFYTGNNPSATGTYAPPSGVSISPISETISSIHKASLETEKRLTPQEASHYWFRKGLAFIGDNPRQYRLLLIKKFLLFWNKSRLTVNINYDFCKRFLPVLKLPLFSFGVLAPFAILGIILLIKEKCRNGYLIISFTLSTMLGLVIFFVTARYRLVAVPFVAITASFALYKCFMALRIIRIKEIAIFIGIIPLCFIFVNRDLPINHKYTDLMSYSNLGNVYAKKHRFKEAILEYRKALLINPDFAVVHNNLGNVYMSEGLLDEAIREYNKALESGMVSCVTRYNLGNAYYRKGLLDEAIVQYQKSVDVNPHFSKAYYNLSACYDKKNDSVKALYHCKKAIENGFKVDPELLSKLKDKVRY